MYNSLITFGDVIGLDIVVDSNKLIKEIQNYNWEKYNKKKINNRYGLSITSLDGELCGIDLDSIYEFNDEHKTNYTESNFKEKTQIYADSEEIQHATKIFDKYLLRTHLLKLDIGGFFSPHRDCREQEQQSFRVIVPIKNCNPPKMYFIYDGKILHFNCGQAYFLNTNKEHCLFSFVDNSIMLVMNIECNKNSIDTVLQHMNAK